MRSMHAVNKKFGEVESIYRQIHGEAISQQGAIDSVEASTLKSALLTDETIAELEKTKKKRDKRLKFRLICIGLFFLVLIVWFGLVIGLRRAEH